MRKSALLIIIIMIFIFSACQTSSISTVNMDATVDIKPTVTTTPTKEPEQTVISTVTPTIKTVGIQKEVENTSIPQSTINTTETVVATTPVIEETKQPTGQPTEKPAFMPNSTIIPTPSPYTTPEPTLAPEYTVISSLIQIGALEGINEARKEEGHPPASLSSSLNAKAEAHAIEMAKSNSLYHSSMGYVESVRSGAFIGGWAEGYGAANHATQLCLDANIVNIGVGCAKSADGTVYTCIIGTS